MAIHSVRAREFWHALESSGDETDHCFQRGGRLRSSCSSGPVQPLGPALHGPVWGSIYCTMRDRTRSRGRSSSASHQPQRSASASERSAPSPGRVKPTKMTENDIVVPQRTYNAPKRYETTCYFMPLAVPVWYSSSVSFKINSTKRNYKETVNYQKKLVPYRFVETMTTETTNTAPVLYVSEEVIGRKIPEGEHYISLEAQQTTNLAEKPFSSNHQMTIENHT